MVQCCVQYFPQSKMERREEKLMKNLEWPGARAGGWCWNQKQTRSKFFKLRNGLSCLLNRPSTWYQAEHDKSPGSKMMMCRSPEEIYKGSFPIKLSLYNGRKNTFNTVALYGPRIPGISHPMEEDPLPKMYYRCRSKLPWKWPMEHTEIFSFLHTQTHTHTHARAKNLRISCWTKLHAGH